MAVTLGTVTTANCNNGSTTTTFSFTSTSEPLYVSAGWWGSGNTLNTVTFNGVGLTRVAQSGQSSGQDQAEIWRLLSPSATTANIVLTFSTTINAGACGAANTAGQDTGGTPEGTA